MTYPTPAEIRAAREAAGLTQTQAATLVHVTPRNWQQWEDSTGGQNTRKMPAGLWELFNRKSEERMRTNYGNVRVDEAGYPVTTEAHIRTIAGYLVQLTQPRSDEERRIFGDLPVDQMRAEVSHSLREYARRLVNIAADLDGPRIDESDSPRVGFDADHSIIR